MRVENASVKPLKREKQVKTWLDDGRQNLGGSMAERPRTYYLVSGVWVLQALGKIGKRDWTGVGQAQASRQAGLDWRWTGSGWPLVGKYSHLHGSLYLHSPLYVLNSPLPAPA